MAVNSVFEVTSYEHPVILVMSRRTGETYRFLVGEDGALVNDGTRFELGDPSRKAVEYLYQKRAPKDRARRAGQGGDLMRPGDECLLAIARPSDASLMVCNGVQHGMPMRIGTKCLTRRTMPFLGVLPPHIG
jgi:hypothetical protein